MRIVNRERKKRKRVRGGIKLKEWRDHYKVVRRGKGESVDRERGKKSGG